MTKPETTEIPIYSQQGTRMFEHELQKKGQIPPDESVTITIRYINHANEDNFEMTSSWNRVPDQLKVVGKANDLINSLYKQVR